MIKIENVVTPSGEQWEAIIRGMRNPMNSWAHSDSGEENGCFVIGPNDYNLMTRLRNAGTDHRKFMRMIVVYADITAPLYWFKEYDTYKIGTVANSTSTMHKIHAKEFVLDDFSHEHLLDSVAGFDLYPPKQELNNTIFTLNKCREKYLETKDKVWWWQMIQLLPDSYNQRRTVMLNYEVLANMYRSRKDHKLDEWRDVCAWIKTLPYSELITGETDEGNEIQPREES